MSACPLLDRVTMINTSLPQDLVTHHHHKAHIVMPRPMGQPPLPPFLNGATFSTPPPPLVPSGEMESALERDYYGCYCLKFIVKSGTHITEDKVLEDFGHFGEVVDVRGPGLFSGLRGNHVYVRFIEKVDAEEALRQLSSKYHQLTPASISDVLPDNYGLYTISFYNKTGIPSSEVRKEFSKIGEVKNLTGSLDVKGGRIFVSYKDKTSAVQALQAFFFRKDKYPNMKFALPRCEKDYFGCYCLKFYNKSGDVTEDKVLKDFGHFGEVVDVRGPGLFDVTGDDVYVRYKEKSSAEQALIELVGKYDSLCLAPPSDIQADKFGYYTITFVNDKCLSKSDVWYIFSKFGTVACVNGTFDCKKGRVFVSYKEKQGALNALETMLITKEYHLQVSKNSTVRKNDYNVAANSSKDNSDNSEMSENPNGHLNHSSYKQEKSGGYNSGQNHSMNHHNHQNGTNGDDYSRNGGHQRSLSHHRENGKGSDQALKSSHDMQMSMNGSCPPPVTTSQMSYTNGINNGANMIDLKPPCLPLNVPNMPLGQGGNGKSNGLVKFNRNVEKDIFGYFCLSFLNEDGDINEKKVRLDFGKFGEVVSVRGALGKQKGHVFVRFRKKEAAENCLNCLNSFPLSEMSELFGKYLFLSPATPRDIDCDMYGLYSISFLNLNMKSFREIRQEFAKFGEIVRLTSGGSGNTDELVSLSYADKSAAIKALQTHFTNKEYPYLDIAKGSSLLLVNAGEVAETGESESNNFIRGPEAVANFQQQQTPSPANSSSPQVNGSKAKDPFHDPSPSKSGPGGSDVVDELLKPLQSYFSIYRTGQYASPLLDGIGLSSENGADSFLNGHKSPDKKYRIKNVKNGGGSPSSPQHMPMTATNLPPPPQTVVSNGNLIAVNVPPPNMDSLLVPYKHEVTEKVEEPPVDVVGATQEPVQVVDQAGEPSPVREDFLGLFSLSFVNRSKELTEKKVKSDFGQYGEVSKVRGQFGNTNSTDLVVVSYSDKDECQRAVSHPALKAKYPSLASAPSMDVVPDKDGQYKIEFVNSGMSCVREITDAFSRHGNVTKVSAGGAKNAVKRVSVSYEDRESALAAVRANANSKDYVAIDFARECLFQSETNPSEEPT